MKWFRALFAALTAFFAALRGQPNPADAQAEQDQIVQETQDEIAQVPSMDNGELLDAAIDSGLVASDPRLVQRSTPSPGSGAGGADDLADKLKPGRTIWGEANIPRKTPPKTNDKPDS